MVWATTSGDLKSGAWRTLREGGVGLRQLLGLALDMSFTNGKEKGGSATHLPPFSPMYRVQVGYSAGWGIPGPVCPRTDPHQRA